MELLLNVVFAWAAVIMMGLLSIIYILRIVNKKFYNNQHSALKKINKALRKPHKWMGILAVFFGFIHGLYSSAKVFTINKGTILWVILIALGINFYLRKTILKGRPWIKAHRKLAILSIAFLLLHLLEVNWFVGIEALQASLERDLRSGISYENFLPNEMKKTLGIEQIEGHGNLITEGKTGGIVYEDALSNALIQDDKAPEEDLLPIKAKSLGEEHRLGHGSEEGKKTKQVFFWGRKDEGHRDRDHDDDYRDNYRDDDDYRDGYRDDDDD